MVKYSNVHDVAFYPFIKYIEKNKIYRRYYKNGQNATSCITGEEKK